MKTLPLHEARRALADARSAAADHDNKICEAELIVSKAKALLEEIRLSGARFDRDVGNALAQESLAEEAALYRLNLWRAGQIIAAHHRNPVNNHSWVIAQVALLRKAVRVGLDKRADEQLHSLIQEALTHGPQPDDLNTPTNILRGVDWPARRKAALLEAEQAGELALLDNETSTQAA